MPLRVHTHTHARTHWMFMHPGAASLSAFGNKWVADRWRRGGGLVLYTSSLLHPDEFFNDEITGRRSRSVNFRLLVLVPDRIHPSRVRGVSSISLIYGISSTLKRLIVSEKLDPL